MRSYGRQNEGYRLDIRVYRSLLRHPRIQREAGRTDCSYVYELVDNCVFSTDFFVQYVHVDYSKSCVSRGFIMRALFFEGQIGAVSATGAVETLTESGPVSLRAPGIPWIVWVSAGSILKFLSVRRKALIAA